MKPIRTMLFVPGIKETWFEKVPSYQTDTVILDLEDSVPENLKNQARTNVSDAIKPLTDNGQRVYVRINRGPYCFNIKDLEAIIKKDLEGIVLPKLDGPEDIELIHRIISEIEFNKGLEVGSIKLIPTLETAKSIHAAYDIAIKPRVVALAGVSPRSGDVERELNYQWTAEGLERLYIRSHVVLAAKAAKVQPIGGLWQDIKDLEGLRKAAQFNRQLGFSGEMVIHPSHVPIVNEVYSPTEKEIAYYEGMIEAFNEALKEGRAAIVYEGEHIDYAHVKTAKQYVEAAKNYISS
ncbi:CoA ester lyase [Bacillus sp. P1(2020)]|uniref:CoA ester lyase n=1 Tax=Pallidibacillus pasinlerensis TaxID=2703818 RepID=A0ABX0A077_9BACI|nr:CoA ester lyase [Pallidibacillus pasinlerensis]